MCIFVAIAGAGVASAAGSAIAGNQAAKATEGATNASIAAQKSALTQQEALNAPYAAIGTGTNGQGGAIQQYQNLLGLGPQGAAGEQATLAQTPGYQFAKQQGLTATENQATATGMGLSGNTLEALDTFSTGLADSTYQSAVGNAEQAVTIGQNAAAGTGAAVQNSGNNISSLLSNQGNNIAGIDANTIAGITKGLGGAAGQAATYSTLQNLINSQNAGAGGPG